jgi:hypothetical protein
VVGSKRGRLKSARGGVGLHPAIETPQRDKYRYNKKHDLVRAWKYWGDGEEGN